MGKTTAETSNTLVFLIFLAVLVFGSIDDRLAGWVFAIQGSIQETIDILK